MDNRGFTLIELLAVIIVLGIVSAITVTTVGGSLSNAKAKSEKVFINNVTKAVDAYIAEDMTTGWNGAENYGKYTKYNKDNNECDSDANCKVDVYKRDFDFQKVIDNGYLKEKEITNPNNDSTSCYDNSTKVIVYRDSDYVYCFMVKLDCLNKDGKVGVINTCPFKLKTGDTSFGTNIYYTIDLNDDGTVNTNSKLKNFE